MGSWEVARWSGKVGWIVEPFAVPLCDFSIADSVNTLLVKVSTHVKYALEISELEYAVV